MQKVFPKFWLEDSRFPAYSLLIPGILQSVGRKPWEVLATLAIKESNVFCLRPSVCPCQKYDYDSSTVRKKFFREAVLQIIIPYMLKQLSPSFHLVRLTEYSDTPQTLANRMEPYNLWSIVHYIGTGVPLGTLPMLSAFVYNLISYLSGPPSLPGADL